MKGESMNILAIGCHPDDVEINCVGTLIRCVQRGDNVTVCHFCNGNMGHEVIMPDELRLIRAAEAEKAGRLPESKLSTATSATCLQTAMIWSRETRR